MKWAFVHVPLPSNAPTLLDSISCSSVRARSAIGYADLDPLVERWNGRFWAVQQAPYTDDLYWWISCPSDTLCVAVGQCQDSRDAVLVECLLDVRVEAG